MVSVLIALQVSGVFVCLLSLFVLFVLLLSVVVGSFCERRIQERVIGFHAFFFFLSVIAFCSIGTPKSKQETHFMTSCSSSIFFQNLFLSIKLFGPGRF